MRRQEGQMDSSQPLWGCPDSDPQGRKRHFAMPRGSKGSLSDQGLPLIHNRFPTGSSPLCLCNMGCKIHHLCGPGTPRSGAISHVPRWTIAQASQSSEH